MKGKRWIMGAALVVALVATTEAWTEEAIERERGVPDKRTLVMPPAASVSAEVIVKFREGSRVWLGSRGLESSDASTLAPFAALLAGRGLGTDALKRLHTRPAADLDAERQVAEAASGLKLADLNLYCVMKVATPVEAIALARELNRLDIVELAEPAPAPAPPPVDLSPPTSNLTARQGYRAAPPTGIGALPPGFDGPGVRIVDIEYSWVLNHEDLELPASSNIDTATAVDPFNDTNHGTAVLGELRGGRNGYGVTGLGTRAHIFVAPANTAEFGYNLPRAISLATGRLRAGDVILIEQQLAVCGGAFGGPVEYYQSIFDVIRTATARDIVVVEAAGNGNVDLDQPACMGRFNRGLRDSGAIIVGAGQPRTRERLTFSSFGSRVDLQGWGSDVTTTGYGDAFDPGDIRQRYTFLFNGTSSASAIVAGAVLEIQGVLKNVTRSVARPKALRAALVATGSAQGQQVPGHMGPLPNVGAALIYVKKIGSVALTAVGQNLAALRSEY
jgi:serine protease